MCNSIIGSCRKNNGNLRVRFTIASNKCFSLEEESVLIVDYELIVPKDGIPNTFVELCV
jgi:hypothetical protein